MSTSGTATAERRGMRRTSAPAPRAEGPRSGPPSGRGTRTTGRARRTAGALLATIVAAGIVVALATRSGGAAKVAFLQPGRVPAAYHVVYQVTTSASVGREELWVNRPFEAEDVTYDSHGTVTSTVVSRLGRQLIQAGGTPGVLDVPPGPAAFDLRLDAVLAAALRSGALHDVGQTMVAGRPCHILRSGQSLFQGTLAAGPAAATYVDSCVDASGLVLDERQVSNGAQLRDRRAVSVDDSPRAVSGHRFATSGRHISLADGGGQVVTVSATSRPPGLDFWELPTPPAGFDHLGRFAVVPPQPSPGPNQTPSPLVTAIDDVYVRGPDVVVVEQGENLSGGAFQPPTGGVALGLGALGRGQLLLSAQASTITVLSARATSFVRVSGTVPSDTLVGVARALQRKPGATLVTVPDLTSDGA